MDGADDIFKYLEHNRTLRLTLHKGDISLYATADAAFDVYPDSKSHSGGTIHLGKVSASFYSLTLKQAFFAHTLATTIVWQCGILEKLRFPKRSTTYLLIR